MKEWGDQIKEKVLIRRGKRGKVNLIKRLKGFFF